MHVQLSLPSAPCETVSFNSVVSFQEICVGSYLHLFYVGLDVVRCQARGYKSDLGVWAMLVSTFFVNK